MMELLANDLKDGNGGNDDAESRDVVDFVRPTATAKRRKGGGGVTKMTDSILVSEKTRNETEMTSRVKSSIASFENLSIFKLPHRNRSARTETAGGCQTTANSNEQTATTTSSKDSLKFVKRASIARLLGQTYSTKNASAAAGAAAAKAAVKSAHPTKSLTTYQTSTTTLSAANGTINASTFPERFQRCSENHVDAITTSTPTTAPQMSDFCEDSDLGTRTLKIISKGLGRFFWKKSYSVDISEPDPEFKVSYLGNVLTGWAKGENCVDKPLATLWRNYTYNNRRDVSMHVRVCSSGLKAATRQHGVTEYWSHRITHCCQPKNNPKIFCWIYRHEGRKLKHELRCHAVLCPKESISEAICKKLQDNLSRALIEFKRDKVSKQNARLSLVNSVYENPSMPQRKIMLSVGANNYRPPLERSKSAPRLMAIDEAAEDEVDDEDDENRFASGGVEKKRTPAESRPCCTVDPLYPAMTLGRRRCKRGHSIRRTGMKPTRIPNNNSMTASAANGATTDDTNDDLDKLLLSNNYDKESPLEGELMTYLDNRLKMKTTSMLDLQPIIADDGFMYEPESMKTTLSLDDLDRFDSDDAEDVANESNDDDEDDQRVQYFVSNKPLELILTSNNMSSTMNNGGGLVGGGGRLKHPNGPDSDESSLSSGCESVSTVTTSIEVQEALAKIDDTDKNANHLDGLTIDGSGSDECSSLLMTSTTTMTSSMSPMTKTSTITIKCNGHHREGSSDSESEFSDESGYVEYKENAKCKQVDLVNNNNNNNNHIHNNNNNNTNNCNIRSE